MEAHKSRRTTTRGRGRLTVGKISFALVGFLAGVGEDDFSQYFAVFFCVSFWAGVRMPSPCPRLDPVSVRASDTRRCERNLEWGGVTSDGEKAQGGPRIGAEMSDNFEPQSTP